MVKCPECGSTDVEYSYGEKIHTYACNSCGNVEQFDDDLDDLIDEDGPEDLNKDNFITQMRVKDPEGQWIPHPTDPRLMRRAEAKKGEKGIYKISSELFNVTSFKLGDYISELYEAGLSQSMI